MAKQRVVEIQCDRCKRKEYRPVSKEESEVHKVELELDFRGIKIKFDDLCEPCRNTVGNYIENIKKEPKGKSPERKAKEKPPAKGKGSSSSQDSGEPS